MKFWFFLTIILDIYPWAFLQYLPFGERLRFSKPVTAAAVVMLSLPYQLMLVWVGLQPWGNLELLSYLRMGQLLLVVALSLWLIRDQVAKILFISGMVMPVTMFVMTLSGYLRTWIPQEAPVYMITSLLRLGLSVPLYLFLRRQWKWNLIPAVNLLDRETWNFSWPLPATVTCVTVLYTHTGIEIYGVSFVEVMVRLCLLAVIFIMAAMVFRISQRTEERIRMAEEVERNRLLLSAQKEQYDLLAEGIQKTQRDVIQMHGHLAKIQTLAEEDPHKLRAYVAELMEQVDQKQPKILEQSAGEILGHYMAIAEKEEIPVKLEANIPGDLAIDMRDLGILLGNLFENAIEASRDLPKEQRMIEITAGRRRGILRVQFRNRYQGEVRQLNGRMLSKKFDYKQPGVGLSTVWAVTDQYGGELRIEHADGIFTVNASLPETDEE